MILRKLFAIYLCANLRSALLVNFARVMWRGFKKDCTSLWGVQK